VKRLVKLKCFPFFYIFSAILHTTTFLVDKNYRTRRGGYDEGRSTRQEVVPILENVRGKVEETNNRGCLVGKFKPSRQQKLPHFMSIISNPTLQVNHVPLVYSPSTSKSQPYQGNKTCKLESFSL
jgi:hypothetical protein